MFLVLCVLQNMNQNFQKNIFVRKVLKYVEQDIVLCTEMKENANEKISHLYEKLP
jgi:hypothetical protein